MKLKVRDRHVIGVLLIVTALALTLGGCEAEAENERGRNVRMCLEDDHTPEECALLFPSPHAPKADEKAEKEN